MIGMSGVLSTIAAGFSDHTYETGSVAPLRAGHLLVQAGYGANAACRARAGLLGLSPCTTTPGARAIGGCSIVGVAYYRHEEWRGLGGVKCLPFSCWTSLSRLLLIRCLCVQLIVRLHIKGPL